MLLRTACRNAAEASSKPFRRFDAAKTLPLGHDRRIPQKSFEQRLSALYCLQRDVSGRGSPWGTRGSIAAYTRTQSRGAKGTATARARVRARPGGVSGSVTAHTPSTAGTG
jgi:hypothetical protein